MFKKLQFISGFVSLVVTGADHSIPTLPLVATVGGLLLLGTGFALRSYLRANSR